jgi:hypothetical protein
MWVGAWSVTLTGAACDRVVVTVAARVTAVDVDFFPPPQPPATAAITSKPITSRTTEC